MVDYINEQASSYQACRPPAPHLTTTPTSHSTPPARPSWSTTARAFGVNTIKAILGDDGLIDIVSSDFSGNAVTFYEDCPTDVFQIAGSRHRRT